MDEYGSVAGQGCRNRDHQITGGQTVIHVSYWLRIEIMVQAQSSNAVGHALTENALRPASARSLNERKLRASKPPPKRLDSFVTVFDEKDSGLDGRHSPKRWAPDKRRMRSTGGMPLPTTSGANRDCPTLTSTYCRRSNRTILAQTACIMHILRYSSSGHSRLVAPRGL